MSVIKINWFFTLGLLAVFVGSQATAGTTTFSSQSAWFAALGGATQKIETFEGTGNLGLKNASHVLGDLTVSGNNFVSGSSASITNDFLKSEIDIDSFTPSDIVTLSVGAPIFAFGFNYDPGDAGGERLRVRLDGADLAVLDNQLGDPVAFFGVVEDTGAAIGDISITSASGNGMFTEIETVRWAEVTAVPAPITGILFLTALAMLRLSTYRRQAV